MVDSGRAHAKEYFPELLLPVSLSPQWATAAPPPPSFGRRPSNTSRYVLFSLLWGHFSFPWVLMHTLLCVCPPRVESLFPPVLSNPAIKSARLQSLILWEFLLLLLDPQVGNPDMGFRTFTPVGGLLWYNCSPVCESHTQWLWDWFYCDCAPPTISLWLLLCLWVWGIFFGEFQCLPFDDCSAVSYDSGALTRGNEHMSFYSAILNQSDFSCFMCFNVYFQH